MEKKSFKISAAFFFPNRLKDLVTRGPADIHDIKYFKSLFLFWPVFACDCIEFWAMYDWLEASEDTCLESD